MGAMSAAATPVPTGITWEEFLELPDDDVYRHAELIDGEAVLNPPVPLNQQVIMRLLGAIDAWTQAGEGRGEVTFDPAVQITANRGYLPDAAWYPPERCAPPGQPPAWSGPPARGRDLAEHPHAGPLSQADRLRPRGRHRVLADRPA